MNSKSINLGSNSFDIPWNYISLLSLTTILIVPWWVTDGFNTGKFITLVIFALFFVSKLGFREIKLKLKVIDKRVILLILIFPVNLIVVFAFNEANKLQQLYGEFGRRTGLLNIKSAPEPVTRIVTVPSAPVPISMLPLVLVSVNVKAEKLAP